MERRCEAHRTISLSVEDHDGGGSSVYYDNRGDVECYSAVVVLGDDDQVSSDGVSCGGNVNIYHVCH